MNTLRPVIMLEKIFSDKSTISQLETYFQLKWDKLEEELKEYFSKYPDANLRMEIVIFELSKNFKAKYNSTVN